MFSIVSLNEWVPPAGSVICWQATARAVERARQAPVSADPPSYQQAQHLRRFVDHANRGVEMSRLMIMSWDIPGKCDKRAMTYVINAHLRRHDTYHSWFDLHDPENPVRHTIVRPTDINVAGEEHGEMTHDELRALILSTPDPRHWAGFRFGIIQHADHFTFFASIAHLFVDPSILGVLLAEIDTMYGVVASGAPPMKLPAAGSYAAYCAEQRRYTSGLTAQTPEVRRWIEFAQNSGGSLPKFPLALGDLSMSCSGEAITMTLMDESQTQRFESACDAGGTRFSGGVFACAALAQYELTGAESFHVVTPIDTRRSPELFTTTGWFTGLVPVSVTVTPTSFSDTARAAQASFDSGVDLAQVPFDRVVALSSPEQAVCRPQPGNLVMSFLDASVAPLSIVANSDLNFRVIEEGKPSHQVSMWVTRLHSKTVVTLLFPGNAVARESIVRYLEAMKSVYVRIAEGRRHGGFVAQCGGLGYLSSPVG
ncbi:condensation domain-containing protein [Mycolicibacterium sp. CBM1]